jgi:thiamine monophosphate synthase
VQPVRELAAKPLVAIGGGTKPVIEVGESGDRELSVFRKFTQQEQQCDRIGSARNCDEHTTAGRA